MSESKCMALVVGRFHQRPSLTLVIWYSLQNLFEVQFSYFMSGTETQKSLIVFGLAFHGFSHPPSTAAWEYYLESSRNEQVKIFLPSPILSSMMQSCNSLLGHNQDVSQPSAPHFQGVLTVQPPSPH